MIQNSLLNIATKIICIAGNILTKNLITLRNIKINTKKKEYYELIINKIKQFIILNINKKYPKHKILINNYNYINESSIWIIDLIDGINNYIKGFPFYCISIAYQKNNKIKHAIIYNPAQKEYFITNKGNGSQLNNYRIRVSQTYNLNSALIGIEFSSKNISLKNQYLFSLNTLLKQNANIRKIGSIALTLAYVACGKLDGTLIFNDNIKNIISGSLLIKESGGLIINIKKTKSIKINYFTNECYIIAGNPKIFKILLQITESFSQSKNVF
ncbi:inositol monophosphatase family protein [Candidatus Legionella polyplacis]|uniref:Inositol monophosphatase family protein n=1 Tax=Candidatus Legionella polyplacis TaxID=2005262 RepID=A0ABZ2GXE3_9GAMM